MHQNTIAYETEVNRKVIKSWSPSSNNEPFGRQNDVEMEND